LKRVFESLVFESWALNRRGPGNRIQKGGGIMIDSNQNEFAGATPVSDTSASWNWLRDRVRTGQIDSLNTWIADDLLELEAVYDGWVTAKSRQLALSSELRSSRS
jgi:hypothetical protein